MSKRLSYVERDDKGADGNAFIKGHVMVDQGFALKATFDGSQQVNRDPVSEFNLWGKSVGRISDGQGGMQLAKDTHYCPCCGDVRPDGLFNTMAMDKHLVAALIPGIRLEAKVLGYSTILNGLLKTTTTLFKWCRACQQVYAPDTLGLQYCPKCQKWHEPELFYNENSWLCIEHTNQYNNSRYADKLGRQPRAYAR